MSAPSGSELLAREVRFALDRLLDLLANCVAERLVRDRPPAAPAPSGASAPAAARPAADDRTGDRC
jgi:hypothetical protein